MDLAEAKRVLSVLHQEGVEYVLVGSMAMAAQGLVRATRDMDLFVAPAPDNVERLRRALKALFEDDPTIDEITSQDLQGDYPALEYTPPNGEYSLDILARLGEAYRYDDLESEILELDVIPVRVATPRTLYPNIANIRRRKPLSLAPEHPLPAGSGCSGAFPLDGCLQCWGLFSRTWSSGWLSRLCRCATPPSIFDPDARLRK